MQAEYFCHPVSGLKVQLLKPAMCARNVSIRVELSYVSCISGQFPVSPQNFNTLQQTLKQRKETWAIRHKTPISD